MNLTRLFILGIFVCGLIISCGGGDKAETALTDQEFLPVEFANLDIKQTIEPQTYVGESLYEYINGGAEMYHLYNFIDVTTASYEYNGSEIVVDIYQFDTPKNCYSLYTLMRPDNPTYVDLGVEGFSSAPNIDFVKGQYMLRLIGFDDSEATLNGIKKLAKQMAKIIPGSSAYPAYLKSFPTSNKLAYSDKAHAEAYLGHGFMSHVFTQDYLLDGDTLTLFFTDDPNGEKYLKIHALAVIDNGVKKALENIPFDTNKAVLLADSYYGNIIAGLKNGKLLGVINYEDNHKQFIIDWLNSL